MMTWTDIDNYLRRDPKTDPSEHKHETSGYTCKYHDQAIATTKAKGKSLNIGSSSTCWFTSKHRACGRGISSLGGTSACGGGCHCAHGTCVDSYWILRPTWMCRSAGALAGRIAWSTGIDTLCSGFGAFVIRNGLGIL